MDNLNLWLTLILALILTSMLPVFGPAMLAAIWITFRPKAFELSDRGLRIIWYFRDSQIPFEEMEQWQLVSRGQIDEQHGRGLRFGAGGFGGAFGQLLCPKQKFSMYISRMDKLIVIYFKQRPPLLISPHSPGKFMNELELRMRNREQGAVHK